MEQELKELFESGSLLHRNYAGHFQMLMNEGTFIEIMQKAQEEIQLLKNEIESLGRLSDIQHQTIMDLEKAQEEKPTLKDFTAKIEKEAEELYPKEGLGIYQFEQQAHIKARLMGFEERTNEKD